MTHSLEVAWELQICIALYLFLSNVYFGALQYILHS